MIQERYRIELRERGRWTPVGSVTSSSRAAALESAKAVAGMHPDYQGEPLRVVPDDEETIMAGYVDPDTREASRSALERYPNPRRSRRRRNPKWRPDGAAAVGLGAVGAAMGLISTLAAGAAKRTWVKLALGTAAGAATGAVLGATLPKGRSSNPRNPRNPRRRVTAVANPVGVATAVGAGILLAAVPTAIALRRMRPMAALSRTAAPTVRARFGPHTVDVFRQGATWGWRAPALEMAGAGDSRREAIINAYSEIVVADLQPDAGLVLDFYPEQFQVKVEPEPAGDVLVWGWSTTTGEGGDADSRGDAMLKALDWVDDHSQLA